MAVTLTISIDAADLADLGRQIDSVEGLFRSPPPPVPQGSPAKLKPNGGDSNAFDRTVPAAAHPGATGGPGVDGAAEGEASASAGSVGADQPGAGDGAAGPVEPEASAKPRRRRRADQAAQGEEQLADPTEVLPAEPDAQAVEPVSEAGREPATLAVIQGLAKALGAREAAGVEAVQRIFAKHGVRTPKDIDPAKLEALRDDFETELAQ